MKRLKKILALVTCGIIAFACTACSPAGGSGGGGGIDTSNMTVITMYVGGGGYGTTTFKNRALRFAEHSKGKSYEEGKMGAYVDVKAAPDSGTISIDQSLLAEGYHIISGGSYWQSLQTIAQDGYIANLDDIMRTPIPGEGNTTIIDKIDKTQRWTYALEDPTTSNADGLEYYAFPGVESYGGLTYDKDMFDTMSYYFAKPDAPESDSTKAYSSIVNELYTFTKVDEYKSVGPDGLPNTEDDGMPSSLFELIALCERIKGDSIYPFIYTKQYSWYINYFADALYASLLGAKNASAINNFKSDSMDIVVGFTNEDLFEGVPELGLKVPVTVSIPIDESCGYYATHSLEKYYVYAFFQLMETQNWYKPTGTKSHTEVQADFIFGKKYTDRRAAMLVECSYWYNESTIRGNFTDWDIDTNNATREIRWMALPGNIKTTVTGEEGSVNTGFNVESTAGESIVLSSSGDGFMAVNKRYENDPVVMEVIKDYLLFIFSDAELSKFTVDSRYSVAVNYDVNPEDYENANSYTQSLMKLTKNATVAYAAGDSDVYRNNVWRFVRGGNSGFFATDGAYSTSIRESLSNNGGPLACFKGKIIDKKGWENYYGNGNFAEVPSSKTYPVGHLKEGQEIVFAG